MIQDLPKRDRERDRAGSKRPTQKPNAFPQSRWASQPPQCRAGGVYIRIGEMEWHRSGIVRDGVRQKGRAGMIPPNRRAARPCLRLSEAILAWRSSVENWQSCQEYPKARATARLECDGATAAPPRRSIRIVRAAREQSAGNTMTLPTKGHHSGPVGATGAKLSHP